jgi:hypothetical protein
MNDEDPFIEPQGGGRGGIRIPVTMNVATTTRDRHFDLTADLSGGVLGGPMGTVFAKVLRSDVRKSVNNLAAPQ